MLAGFVHCQLTTDNDVRRIDNSMLSDWGSQLRKAAKNEPQRLAEVIRNIDSEVNSLLD